MKSQISNFKFQIPKEAWTPCAQELPDCGITVMVSLDDGDVWFGWREADDEWRSVDAGLFRQIVLAWMHLPEPYKPKEGK